MKLRIRSYMERIKLIVCCHKEDIKASADVYMPLHVGKALSNKELGIACDNTGKNISHKNASHCELTGMYWAWKNLTDEDYIGLCHYRRYFDFHRLGRKGFPITTFPSSAFSSTDISITDEAREWLRQGYVILPKAWHLRTSVYLDYCERHSSSDFRQMGDVVRQLSPASFDNAIMETMVRSNQLCPLNMFVMSWSQFDEYCSWLFPILEELEKRIDISAYDAVQRRIFGYMGERLLNVYVWAKQLPVKQLPILKFSEEEEVFGMSFPKYKLRCCLNDLALRMTRY